MNQAQAIQKSGILTYLFAHPAILILFFVWVFAWKGLALWKAARLSHKWWFVILLVANTAGLLEIIYMYFVARKFVVEEEVEVTEVEVESESA